MSSEEQKAQAAAWFEALRDRICAALEAIEDAYDSGERQRFQRKNWDREGGGGGTMAMMKGRVFEKVGVNISTVYGRVRAAIRQGDSRRRQRSALLGERHLAVSHIRTRRGADRPYEHPPHRHDEDPGSAAAAI